MLKVGEVIVKGLAYEDIVSILALNGYATEVYTSVPKAVKNVADLEHHIRIYLTNEEEKKNGN